MQSERLVNYRTLTIRSRVDAEVHSLAVQGELDLATAPVLEREIDRVADSDAKQIVLDLSKLSFIDSTGLRLLLNATAAGEAQPGRIRLRRGSGQVDRIIKLTGIESALPFE